MSGENEREQSDAAGYHSPGAQTVHMAGDCQAEAEDLHPLPSRPGEETWSQHGGVCPVLTVSPADQPTNQTYQLDQLNWH